MGHSGAMRGCRLFHSLCTSDLSLPDQSRYPYLYPCLPEQSLLTLSKVWVPRDTPGTLRARVPTTVGMARAMGSSEWTQSNLCGHPWASAHSHFRWGREPGESCAPVHITANFLNSFQVPPGVPVRDYWAVTTVIWDWGLPHSLVLLGTRSSQPTESQNHGPF